MPQLQKTTPLAAAPWMKPRRVVMPVSLMFARAPFRHQQLWRRPGIAWFGN